MKHLFELTLPGERCILLLDCRKRADLPAQDIACTARLLTSFPPQRRLHDLLTQAHGHAPERPILLLQNPHMQPDAEFLTRFSGLLERLHQTPLDWAIISPTGLEADGNVHTCIYPSATPRLFFTRKLRPIIDCGLDMMLFSPDQLASIVGAAALADLPESSLPQAVLLQGYLEGRVSLYAPQMGFGIDGYELGRSHVEHEAALNDMFAHLVLPLPLPSLSGTIPIEAPRTEPGRAPLHEVGVRVDLMEQIRSTVVRYCTPFSLSVVVRTQFRRPHLLRRLLASATRARREDIALEIVLATDAKAEVAEAALAALQNEFPELVLRIAYGDPARGPSRTSNLLAGIDAAAHRYLALIDDDDYIAIPALAALTTITFLDDEPLVLMASNVMEEVWEETPSGHHVLSSTRQTSTYWADKWRNLFHGSNQLPICALVAPSDWIRRRSAAFNFRHDLSEDYTLHLLLLTAPDLPRIHELGAVLCNISIRNDQSNTVTMIDRRPWVRDITNFLADLLLQDGPIANGTLQLLSGTQGVQHHPGTAAELDDLRRENKKLRGDLLGLRREILALRSAIRDRDEDA